jgi:hypothetical protein
MFHCNVGLVLLETVHKTESKYFGPTLYTTPCKTEQVLQQLDHKGEPKYTVSHCRIIITRSSSKMRQLFELRLAALRSFANAFTPISTAVSKHEAFMLKVWAAHSSEK